MEWFSRFYRAMEFAVWIKCSEGFCGDQGEHSHSVSWHRGSWLLSNQWLKICGHLFLEDAAGGKDHSSTTVKKEEGKKKPNKPTENIWVWCCKPTGKICVLCVLTSWPYKIYHLSFPCFIFQGGKKNTNQPFNIETVS